MNENRKDWYAEEFVRISEKIGNKKQLSCEDFLRIKNYKAQALSIAGETKIRRQTKKAFEAAEKRRDEIETAIKELTALYGVGIATASAILAMKYPKRYAIVDKRVVEALRGKMYKKEFGEALQTPKGYREYLEFMRKMAKKENKNLRLFERELFENE